jgi:hypothetical protein
MEQPTDTDDVGGESACYAHLLCLDCGAVLDAEHCSVCAPHDTTPVTNALDATRARNESK